MRNITFVFGVTLFLFVALASTPVSAKKPPKPTPTVEPTPTPEPPPVTASHQVVFEESYRGGTTDLVVANSDGSGRRVILDAAREVKHSQPRFSPDGSKIVFSSFYSVDNSGIYTIKPDGTDLKLVTKLIGVSSSGYRSKAPVFSRTLIGGKEMILYSDFASSDDSTADLYVVPADGSAEPRNITNSPDRSERNPAWSDDGTFIIAQGTALEGAYFDVYRFELDLAAMQVAGSTNLTAGTVLASDSGDVSMAKGAGDNRVTVVSFLEGNLYMLETDGLSAPIQLTTGSMVDSAAFLPDGSGLVVGTADFTQIYLVDLTGKFTSLVMTKAKKATRVALPDIRGL